MAPVITTRAELLQLIEDAARGPAEHVASTSSRTLAATAPALPALRLPKLTDRVLNGQRVKDLLAAGPRAVLVHSPVGVRVVEDVRTVADDPDVVVIAQHREISRAVTVEGIAPLAAAQLILDRELAAIAAAA